MHEKTNAGVKYKLFAHPGVIAAADISCLVIPEGCLGLPTLAAMEQGLADHVPRA